MIFFSSLGMLALVSCIEFKKDDKYVAFDNNKSIEAEKVIFYVKSTDGKVMKMESIIASDTLVMINMSECNYNIPQKDIQQLVVLAKDSETIIEQSQALTTVNIKDCSKHKWCFCATMGNPTDEQSETTEATRIIVFSDYLKYNGIMYN